MVDSWVPPTHTQSKMAAVLCGLHTYTVSLVDMRDDETSVPAWSCCMKPSRAELWPWFSLPPDIKSKMAVTLCALYMSCHLGQENFSNPLGIIYHQYLPPLLQQTFWYFVQFCYTVHNTFWSKKSHFDFQPTKNNSMEFAVIRTLQMAAPTQWAITGACAVRWHHP